MKRFISLLLTLSLLACPALAAGEDTQARAEQVTLAVKATLDVGDEYTHFTSQPYETLLGTRWELDWSGEDRHLFVTATEEGKIVQMNASDNTVSAVYPQVFGPSFPAMSRAQAQQAAEEFLGRVLTEGESALFEPLTGTESLSASSYFYYGAILLNGLPTPMTFRIRVRLADGEVTYFYRDDGSDYLAVDPVAAAVTAEQAAQMLKTTLALRLEYTSDGEGGARLTYLPEAVHDFYVDGATGELVDLTELRALLQREYGGDKEFFATTDTAASAESSNGGLSRVEQEGIAKLEGVLDQEELDALAKEWTALGLESFTLSSTQYTVLEEEEGEEATVTARLTYAKNTEQGVARRYLTMDAKTGALQAMSGGVPYDPEAMPAVSGETAEATARKFLEALWPDQLALCVLTDSHIADEKGESSHSFTFCQEVNGYLYRENTITVRVEAAGGAILGFSKRFDETVTFAPAEGIISEEEALDIWAESFPVELAYIAVPQALDLNAPEWKPLIEAGYSYYNALKPGYELGDRDKWYEGVDALTGQLKGWEEEPEETMTYDDLDGHWAAATLNELALYGVGWDGGKALPDALLTQMDALLLLVRADGYRFTPDGENTDALYDYAVDRGMLKREERDEDKVLTRADTVRLMLNSTGYGEIAALKGIFRCDFTDAGDIPEEDMGYAALAQGLGLVTGDGLGRFAPGRQATRAELATMLYNYMKR